MDGFNIDNYLRISLTDVVLVCISTFLIVLIAKKFFWDKLLAYIQKRQDLIQGNIDSSVQLKQEAQNIKEQYDEKMKIIESAVNETKGEYLEYDGKVAQAFFFSTSAGKTENSEEVLTATFTVSNINIKQETVTTQVPVEENTEEESNTNNTEDTAKSESEENTNNVNS